MEINEQALAVQAQSAIIYDVNNGKEIFTKNAYDRLPPASMIKIMTLLLAMEAIEKKQISPSDIVTISSKAATTAGSRIDLQKADKITVNDLIKSIAIASACDAAVALAEHISGSETAFIKLMNQKAEALLLLHTHFDNVHGLPSPGNYSTAYDMALLSQQLIKKQEILQIAAKPHETIKINNNTLSVTNTNDLLGNYLGVDGLKTGYTQRAGYCLSATAKVGEKRIIAVVFGEPSPEVRQAELIGMLDYAFKNIRPISGKKIIIDLKAHRLDLVENGEIKKTYPIAVGKKNTPSPVGIFSITEKCNNWGGPFGARWMRLSVPWGGYGIHGTNRPNSIGNDASAGCIRMYNADVKQLYEMVEIGTTVILNGDINYLKLSRGSIGNQVMLLQQKLKNKGYNVGACDGIFGRQTEQALQEFRESNNLQLTGELQYFEMLLLGIYVEP